MNETLDFGWYYYSSANRAPAWSGVEYFYDFLTGSPTFTRENGGTGPFGMEVTTDRVLPGDVVQLSNAEGDFYHTLLVTGAEGDDFLVSAHTNDARNRPLSTYNYASARFLHVMGTRVQLANEECYRQLLEGIAFRPLRCSSDAPILPPPM